jgi:hypothetical protein
MPSFTQYPATSVFTFGCILETGIAVSAYDQNDTVEVFEQKNEINETIEVRASNARAELTITGELTAAATQILGNVLTVANLITAQFGTTVTGVCLVKGVNHSRGRAKNTEIKITATYYPLVTA